MFQLSIVFTSCLLHRKPPVLQLVAQSHGIANISTGQNGQYFVYCIVSKQSNVKRSVVPTITFIFPTTTFIRFLRKCHIVTLNRDITIIYFFGNFHIMSFIRALFLFNFWVFSHHDVYLGITTIRHRRVPHYIYSQP